MKAGTGWTVVAAALLATGVLAFGSGGAQAEYGDVVINNYSADAGMRPVVFPHWFHRVRFRCKVCHGDLGFQFEAGGNDINMVKIIDGQYCGACHDGNLAWSIENCDLCHSGKPGLETHVHKSVVDSLGSAAAAAVAASSEPEASASASETTEAEADE